jgi:hypothetical protein
MDSTPLNAIDAVAPAFNRMTSMIFKPFRFAVWWRLAVLGLFTGEISCGANFHFPTSFTMPADANNSASFAGKAQFPWNAPWDSVPHFFLWMTAGVLVATILILVFMYVSSVLRFVLFDTVLTRSTPRENWRRCIRDGWQRWKDRGVMLLCWQIGFTVVGLVCYLLVAGIPVLLMWRIGLFSHPEQHIATLILSGLALLFVLILVGLVALIIEVLTKDFVIPIMAFEALGPVAAWRRLMRMISASKGSYAGYLGFKALMAIAVGFVISILSMIVAVAIVLPIELVGMLVGFSAAHQSAGMKALVVALLVAISVLVGSAVFGLLSLISVPVVVFFQSYALHFFGSRYEPLRAVMYPPPPQAPPASPIGTPPLPQPAM